jgi:hypothetical protein
VKFGPSRYETVPAFATPVGPIMGSFVALLYLGDTTTRRRVRLRFDAGESAAFQVSVPQGLYLYLGRQDTTAENSIETVFDVESLFADPIIFDSVITYVSRYISEHHPRFMDPRMRELTAYLHHHPSGETLQEEPLSPIVAPHLRLAPAGVFPPPDANHATMFEEVMPKPGKKMHTLRNAAPPSIVGPVLESLAIRFSCHIDDYITNQHPSSRLPQPLPRVYQDAHRILDKVFPERKVARGSRPNHQGRDARWITDVIFALTIVPLNDLIYDKLQCDDAEKKFADAILALSDRTASVITVPSLYRAILCAGFHLFDSNKVTAVASRLKSARVSVHPSILPEDVVIGPYACYSRDELVKAEPWTGIETEFTRDEWPINTRGASTAWFYAMWHGIVKTDVRQPKQRTPPVNDTLRRIRQAIPSDARFLLAEANKITTEPGREADNHTILASLFVTVSGMHMLDPAKYDKLLNELRPYQPRAASAAGAGGHGV